MGSIDFYVITLPFSVMSRYVTTTDRNLPAKERENRKPSPSRYQVIAKYIYDNLYTYRFSSITCTYGKIGTNKPVQWQPASDSGDASFIGLLTLDQRDPLIIVDGQHRYEGIKKAVEFEPSLSDDMISIVLFPYLNIRTAQQLFSDLNRNAKKTTKSLDILFDYRDIKNRVIQKLVEKVSVFKNRVNLEDVGIPASSKDIFTIAGIYQASEPIIDALPEAGLINEKLAQQDNEEGTPINNEDQYTDFLTEVWEFIVSQFPEWSKVASGELDISAVRSSYLHWNSGVLSAIGELVATSMKEKGHDWKEPVRKALSHPDNLGWRREEPYWQGIVTAGTLVLPRSVIRPQLKAYLKKLAGLSLTEGDLKNLKAIDERKVQLQTQRSG